MPEKKLPERIFGVLIFVRVFETLSSLISWGREKKEAKTKQHKDKHAIVVDSFKYVDSKMRGRCKTDFKKKTTEGNLEF